MVYSLIFVNVSIFQTHIWVLLKDPSALEYDYIYSLIFLQYATSRQSIFKFSIHASEHYVGVNVA